MKPPKPKPTLPTYGRCPRRDHSVSARSIAEVHAALLDHLGHAH